MGLSGRKVKQRIGNDPRNLSWADDASRFGQSYLEKFGWDASKGLGASGEGRTNAVKMSQKLDMLGIGMQHHQNDPNGIAWRQNRDFENLLQRLNGGAEAKGSFHKARGSSSPSSSEGEGEEAAAEAVDGAHDVDEGADADATKREKTRGKRKALQEEEKQEQEGSAREAARDKRERKKRKKSKSDVRRAVPENEDDASPSLEPQAESTPVPAAAIAAPAPVRALPRAHRARIIAAKRMAASNSAALAEILGIPSCSSSTTATTTTTTTAAATTPTPTQTQESEDPLQKLTTAALSVGDYLRAKLGAKAAAQPRPTSPPDADADRDRDADADPPRAGLGAARWVPTGPPHEPVRAEAMFAAMFARGQATTGAQEEADGASVERAETHDDEGGAGDEEDRKKKSARRRAREERRKMKKERRRRKEEEEEEAESRAITEPDAEPPNGAPVVEPSIGEARAGRAKRKKHCKSVVLDGLLEDSSALRDGRTVVVSNKKQKKRDKGRKDANP